MVYRPSGPIVLCLPVLMVCCPSYHVALCPPGLMVPNPLSSIVLCPPDPEAYSVSYLFFIVQRDWGKDELVGVGLEHFISFH